MTKKNHPKTRYNKIANVFTKEYIRAAQELNLAVKFITPRHEAVERYIEISSPKKNIRIFRSQVPINNIVSDQISKNKVLVNNLLSEHDICVPKQYVITEKSELKNLKRRLKFPVILKPVFLSKGKGITANIQDFTELEHAFDLAKVATRREMPKSDYNDIGIIIEEMIIGFDHRLTVLYDQMIGAIKKNPPLVIGDGKLTIRKLIEQENKSSMRANGQLSLIKIDNDLNQTLKKQKYDIDDIPEKNHQVILHTISNLSAGATTENITNQVHPKFKKIVLEAVKILDLQFAGVDLIAPDISQNPDKQKWAIIEINSHPGSRLHLYPSIGQPVDIPKIVLQKLFNIK